LNKNHYCSEDRPMENVSFFISKNNTPTAYAKLEIRVIPSGRECRSPTQKLNVNQRVGTQ
jgi:hypothetical protein